MMNIFDIISNIFYGVNREEKVFNASGEPLPKCMQKEFAENRRRLREDKENLKKYRWYTIFRLKLSSPYIEWLVYGKEELYMRRLERYLVYDDDSTKYHILDTETRSLTTREILQVASCVHFPASFEEAKDELNNEELADMRYIKWRGHNALVGKGVYIKDETNTLS